VFPHLKFPKDAVRGPKPPTAAQSQTSVLPLHIGAFIYTLYCICTLITV